MRGVVGVHTESRLRRIVTIIDGNARVTQDEARLHAARLGHRVRRLERVAVVGRVGGVGVARPDVELRSEAVAKLHATEDVEGRVVVVSHRAVVGRDGRASDPLHRTRAGEVTFRPALAVAAVAAEAGTRGDHHVGVVVALTAALRRAIVGHAEVPVKAAFHAVALKQGTGRATVGELVRGVRAVHRLEVRIVRAGVGRQARTHLLLAEAQVNAVREAPANPSVNEVVVALATARRVHLDEVRRLAVHDRAADADSCVRRERAGVGVVAIIRPAVTSLDLTANRHRVIAVFRREGEATTKVVTSVAQQVANASARVGEALLEGLRVLGSGLAGDRQKRRRRDQVTSEEVVQVCTL